jgi:hypothetical protein
MIIRKASIARKLMSIALSVRMSRFLAPILDNDKGFAVCRFLALVGMTGASAVLIGDSSLRSE